MSLAPRYRVRHYKGGIYEYVGNALLEATGEHKVKIEVRGDQADIHLIPVMEQVKLTFAIDDGDAAKLPCGHTLRPWLGPCRECLEEKLINEHQEPKD